MSSPVAVPLWVSLCGSMAPFAAIVVFLAPVPTIQQIGKDRSVGSLPLLPYSSMVANCFLWLTYGVMKGEFKIWFTNLIGLLLGMYYVYMFVQFTPPASPTLPGSLQQHYQGVAAVVAGAGFLAIVPIVNNAAELIGNLAVLFCVAMFGSPLAALKVVLQTKSAASIPLPFTLATVLNCFLWSVLGLIEMKDPNVYVPNLLGLGFGLLQLALKFIFKDKKTARESELELLM